MAVTACRTNAHLLHELTLYHHKKGIKLASSIQPHKTKQPGAYGEIAWVVFCSYVTYMVTKLMFTRSHCHTYLPQDTMCTQAKHGLSWPRERSPAAALTWGSAWPVATSASALLFTLIRP